MRAPVTTSTISSPGSALAQALAPSWTAAGQLIFLLASLTEANFDSRVRELDQLCERFGPPVYDGLYRLLLIAAASAQVRPTAPAPSPLHTVPVQLLLRVFKLRIDNLTRNSGINVKSERPGLRSAERPPHNTELISLATLIAQFQQSESSSFASTTSANTESASAPFGGVTPAKLFERAGLSPSEASSFLTRLRQATHERQAASVEAARMAGTPGPVQHDSLGDGQQQQYQAHHHQQQQQHQQRQHAANNNLPPPSGNGPLSPSLMGPGLSAALEALPDSSLMNRSPSGNQTTPSAPSPSDQRQIDEVASFLVSTLREVGHARKNGVSGRAKSPSAGSALGAQLTTPQTRTLVTTLASRFDRVIFSHVLRATFENLNSTDFPGLTSFLLEVGPDAVGSLEAMTAALDVFGLSEKSQPSEQYVTDIVTSLLQASPELLSHRPATDFSQFCQAINRMTARQQQQRHGVFDWGRVFRSLDERDDLMIPIGSRLDGLGALLVESHAPFQAEDGSWTIEASEAPVSVLWTPWRHVLRQLSLLNGLLNLHPDEFSFSRLPGRKVVTAEDVASASQTIRGLAVNVQVSSWNSLDLIGTLAAIATIEDGQIRLGVSDLLEKAVKSSPECLLMGLVQLPQPWNPIHAELVSKLLAMFLANHPSHQLVFFRIWQSNREYLLQAFRDYYAENPANVNRLLDVAQDLKILDALLKIQPSHLALDIAALASRREYLNLDKWLQDNINESGSAFIQTTLEFVDSKVKDELARPDPQAEQEFQPLLVQTVAIFLRVLRSNGDAMTPEEIEFFKAVRNLCLQLHPRLMNLAPGAENQEPGLQVVTFSADIHEEADNWYRQMYEGQISIEEIVSMLQRLRASSDSKDHQLFACMVHTLFDEYRYFEMYYPQRELAMTAVVFGSLIQFQLIDSIPLGIAVRYVLDALRNPTESNMFKFGLQALMRFQNRLSEWPQLGQALLALPHLQQAYPEVVEALKEAMENPPPPRPATDGEGAAGEEGQKVVDEDGAAATEAEAEPVPPFSAIASDPIPDVAAQQDPDEEVSDKVLFLVNNLSPTNLDAKLPEAQKLLTPDVFHWFSNYLVLQRVSIEPNNHGLYCQLLDGLEKPNLLPYILHETFAKAKVLLNAEGTATSTQDRTILKNLGSWLGALTLAKNKPIRHRNMSFKDLLIEGYDSKRLILAIPFVCKILEQCAKSTVFTPPNPWLMAVLRLLVELYQFAELKLNLKFEIEVLCKSLGIELSDLQPTDILRSRHAAAEAEAQAVLQNEYQARLDAQGGGALTPSVGGAASLSGLSQTNFADTLNAKLANLINFVVINPQLSLFANNSTLKRMICAAIERAIREIITPVVERSVTIASISTRELVTKDFAMEGDEGRMRSAAHQMAQNLAGSLALVTCKEPLRTSMVAHARSLFLSSGFTDQTLPEQALLVIMQDNLELACSIIEKAAMEKAVPEVDDGLAPAYAARRDNRARGRSYFSDPSAMAVSQYITSLPDLLRLRPDGLQPSQLRVYEDFGKLSRAWEEHQPAAAAAASHGYSQDGSIAYHDSPATTEQMLEFQEPGMLTPAQALDKFSQYVAELDRQIGQLRQDNVSTIGPEHEIRLLVRQIQVLATQSSNRDDTALAFSQKIVQLIYKSESDLAREVYIVLLERLFELSLKVVKEVTAWLVYADDERKFNVPATVGLIRARLLNVVEEDQQLAKFILRDFRPSVVEFSAKLVLACLRDPPCATRSQLVNITEALHTAAQRGKATETALLLLEELKDGQLKNKPAVGREQLMYCFAEWVRLFQQLANPEKSFVEFVTELQAQGILKGEEISSLFFRVCTEVSVDSYIKQKAVGGNLTTGIFSPTDAFSKLVVLMIKYHADPTGANNEQAKVHYLTKVLSIVVLVLAQSHEDLGPTFQQKPFFRFFSSLLHDLHMTQGNLQAAYFQTLLAISNTFNTLQPAFFPGFTFSWMSLIAHRLFMPKLLGSNSREGWTAFHRLLSSLLRFMAPFLRAADLQDTSRSLYMGTLRILLVILHDFPEFLVEYHQNLCDIIPASCIQLRNLVLCAFPRDRQLPDPFKAGLRLEHMPECNEPPLMPSDFVTVLQNEGLVADLDKYLSSHQPQGLGQRLAGSLVVAEPSEVDVRRGDSRFNVALVNALVLYVGTVSSQNGAALADGSVSNDAGAKLIHEVLLPLDPEGRYLVLTAAANQLRYPNSHTAYFSRLLLALFADPFPAEGSIKEQVVRVLLERLLVNKPHPWGLLFTLGELLRNPHKYPLPKAPVEIERILHHIRDCLSVGAGGVGNGGDIGGFVGPAIGGDHNAINGIEGISGM
ncbi:CCR4-NOT core subunit cdc39 [Tilletia horrida]|uniref:General negative regulator of transcription subunit 1 n=1 Tax=Tilletia horrida TaxID=155126 RepID=A0AAN6GUQ0_9BASI|nr:CCR4-NOT core subunit cdc39 [Tilletia horrida]KAK0555261.1 CCR4-NOT core subunit cdc39 [Tilletia horrida]